MQGESLSVSLSHVKNSAKERKEIKDTMIKTTFPSQKSFLVKAERLSLQFLNFFQFFFSWWAVGGCFRGLFLLSGRRRFFFF